MRGNRRLFLKINLYIIIFNKRSHFFSSHFLNFLVHLNIFINRRKVYVIFLSRGMCRENSNSFKNEI